MITTSMTDDYKLGLMAGRHNHLVAGNTFKLALYDSDATMDRTTSAYTANDEVSGVGTGYTPTGHALTNLDPKLDGNEVVTQFENLLIGADTSITARGCMIYNDTDSADGSVSVHDFGEDKISLNGSFLVTMPTFSASTALLRLV